MQKLKNIIVIKTDQHRFDCLGYMGHSLVKTPNLDKLATESFIFENSFCVSPLCVPSRVSFFTGQYPHRNGAVSNAMDCYIGSEQFSFIPLLKNAGYKLGLAGKNHALQDELFEDYFDYREEYSHHGKTHGTITDSDRAVSEFRHNETRPGYAGSVAGNIMLGGLIEQPEPFTEQSCMTSRIAEDAITFIRQKPAVPFFLHLSFPDPHWPNIVCEPYYSMYNAADVELTGMDVDWNTHPFAHYVQSQVLGFDTMSEQDRRKIVAAYYGQITFIDKAIGNVLAELKQAGLYDDSIIVFTSDHGDFAGHFGLVEKTKAFYESLLRIPLLIHLPGQTEGKCLDAQVSNIDIMPSILDYLAVPIPREVQGQSILPLLNSRTVEHRQTIFAELGQPENPPPPMPHAEFKAYAAKRFAAEGMFWFIDYTVNGRCAMIRENGWKYCYYVGDKEELYDLNADPSELFNLAEKSEFNHKKSEFKKRLLEWLLTEPVTASQ
ncbi:MAG: sulfatase-like hydrolase/transferase [Victivallaceae bacterium]|nr:sulfatase-like hydrolase/transferase [Victivallaceae bacterium]